MKRFASAAFDILLFVSPVLFALAVVLSVLAFLVHAAPPRARDEVKLPRARDDVQAALPEVVKPAVIEQEDTEAARIEDERQERYQRRNQSFNPWNFQWGNPSRCLGGS